METTTNPYTEQVARGAALLDEKVPGWWRVIKLETLEMWDCHNCMLGQLFGHDVETAIGAAMYDMPLMSGISKADWDNSGYARGKGALDVAGASIGCNLPMLSINNDPAWAQLKCAWADIIAERRATEDTEKGVEDGETHTTGTACVTQGS